MKLLTRLLAILLLVLGSTPNVLAAPLSEQPRENKELRTADPTAVVQDHIIVKFEPGLSRAAQATVHRRLGSRLLKTSRRSGFVLVSIPAGSTVEKTVKAYRARAEVEYAEPDPIVTATMVPNDPLYGLQWHLSNPVNGGINIGPAWDRSTGQGIVVAIVDTGIAYENYQPAPSKRYYQAPDLANTSFAPGYDFINDDAHPNDDQGHGTHVAGTIAQSTNNSLGVAGVAFNAVLMPIKVLNAQGSGPASTVADGIRFAADQNADIISMSLGGGSSITEQAAVDYAYNKGVTIVAASGNENGAVIYPAAYPNVIAVGATRYDETRSYYSNFGPELDVVAPGGDINVDQNGDTYADGVLQQTVDSPHNLDSFSYWFYQGTSMATPHVSALAALILSQDPSMTPADIKSRLETTAEDKGAAGWDQYYGWGLIDADAAVFMPVLSLTAQSLNLASVGAGVSTWPGDNAKNKPVVIDATVPWKLTVSADADFSGGGQALPSSNLKMGPSYAQVAGIPTVGALEVASGSAGSNKTPDLRTTLDVPWDDALPGKTLNATFTYTVLPQ